jgi:hypothetical protein
MHRNRKTREHGEQSDCEQCWGQTTAAARRPTSEEQAYNDERGDRNINNDIVHH